MNARIANSSLVRCSTIPRYCTTLLSVTPEAAPSMLSMADRSQLIFRNNESMPATGKQRTPAQYIRQKVGHESLWNVNSSRHGDVWQTPLLLRNERHKHYVQISGNEANNRLMTLAYFWLININETLHLPSTYTPHHCCIPMMLPAHK